MWICINGGSSFSIRKLVPDTVYSFRICADYKGKESEWSDTISVKTQKLPAPDNITARVESWDKVVLEWNSVATTGDKTAEYTVEMKTGADGKFVNVIQHGKCTEFTASDLNPDTLYGFRICVNMKGKRVNGVT